MFAFDKLREDQPVRYKGVAYRTVGFKAFDDRRLGAIIFEEPPADFVPDWDSEKQPELHVPIMDIDWLDANSN